MKTIRTETTIDASAENVWKTLMDFDSYPEWNPFIIRISGKPEVGQVLRVTVRPSGRKPMTFKPTVVTIDPGRSFRWRGYFINGLLFSGEHGLAVEESGDGRARFVHEEVFRGLLVPVTGGMLKATHKAFSNMNAALKQRVEGMTDAAIRVAAASQA